MHLRRFFLLAPALTAWLGCTDGMSRDSTRPDEVPSPASTVGTIPWNSVSLALDGGGTDGGDTVVLTSEVHFQTAGGTEVITQDLSASSIELFIPNGTTFTRRTGTATPNGYVFTNVPAGTYYLRRNNVYTVTDARRIEQAYDAMGRPDAGFSGSWTPLQLDLTGLDPWAPYETTLQLMSAQVDLYGDAYLYEEPSSGQTTLDTDQAEFSNWAGEMAVLDAAQGDRLYVNQLSPVDAGTLPDGGALTYTTVTRGLQTAPFSFTADGVTPLVLTGELQPVAQTEFSLNFRLGEFTRYASQVHPQATRPSPWFYVSMAPYGSRSGWQIDSGPVLSLTFPRGASFDFTRQLRYGNPYPSTWLVGGSAQSSFSLTEAVPDGSGNQVTQLGSLITYDWLSHLVSTPVQPGVSPPRGLTLDGLSATVQRQLSSTTPVLAWQPPEVGSPNRYRLQFYKYSDLGGYGLMRGIAAMNLPGTATQVRLPPDLLEPGSIYSVRVKAISAPAHGASVPSFTTIALPPIYEADAFTSLFTTP